MEKIYFLWALTEIIIFFTQLKFKINVCLEKNNKKSSKKYNDDGK